MPPIMPRKGVWALSLLLAGCLSAPTESPSTAPPPSGERMGTLIEESFDLSLSLPSGWTSDSGTWRVENSSDARSPPNVLRGVGGGGRSTLRSPGSFLDFEARVEFQMVLGDEGAGLSFRYTPDGEYRIVRYSLREEGWHYFIMKGGRADKRNEATVPQNSSAPKLGEWVDLRVVAEGRHVRAWSNGTLVLDFTETEDPRPGSVGPFLRGGQEALFDNFRVEPK